VKQKNTTGCGKYGHSEFCLYFDDHIIDPWTKWFIDYLETSVQTEKYEDGQTLQVGWMINLIKREGNELTVCEPDFESMPVQWTKSVSRTLSHLFLQKYVAESVSLTQQLNFPRYIDTAIRCSEFGKSGVGFFINRLEPSPNNPRDSGWFLGCLNPEHDHNSRSNLSLVSLYEAATINKFIVPYLALPGLVNVIETGEPDQFHLALEDRELTILPGSYLELWLKDRKHRNMDFARSEWNSLN
jgi:hypothetical protein